jgi:hypothetical protein
MGQHLLSVSSQLSLHFPDGKATIVKLKTRYAPGRLGLISYCCDGFQVDSSVKEKGRKPTTFCLIETHIILRIQVRHISEHGVRGHTCNIVMTLSAPEITDLSGKVYTSSV